MSHSPEATARGERRWPMAVAVLAVIGILALLPPNVRPEPRWSLALIGALLGLVILADPGRIDRRTRVGWMLSLALLFVTIVATLVSTGSLIHQLIVGSTLTLSASRLLWVGNGVWAATIIVFSLLYWECDGGGPAVRVHKIGRRPHIAFPQHMNPELAQTGWRPSFLDYLYLGLTNALAFSPTDAMPLAAWAKIAMAVQSLISVAILGLVVARAVNVFT